MDFSNLYEESSLLFQDKCKRTFGAQKYIYICIQILKGRMLAVNGYFFVSLGIHNVLILQFGLIRPCSAMH